MIRMEMGSNTGGVPGRIAEFDGHLNLVHEWPDKPPADGFNPHGISVRPEINLMVTSDFLNPVSTLNVFPDPIEFGGSIRVWDLAARKIVRTVTIPSAIGTMDVKLIPGDRKRRALTAGMFDSKIYLIDTQSGVYKPVFDALTVGGGPMSMPQILAVTNDGTRLIFPLDDFGKVHFEGDHKVHVLRVERGRLEIDYRFNLDFNTAFAASRPHGIAIK